jgi:DNA-binding MarR family transcriptional regulator
MKNTLSIILYLYKADHSVQKTELYRNISYTSTMPSKLEFLEKEGLIKMKRSTFEKNTTFVELTEKGISIAIHLQNAEKILTEDSS